MADTYLMQVGDVVVVMGKVLGLLWMRNPMTITFQEEQQATIPGRSVTAGRQVPKSSKKGDPACAQCE